MIVNCINFLHINIFQCKLSINDSQMIKLQVELKFKRILNLYKLQ